MPINATGTPGHLRELRRAQGLSQQDVARLADCSVSYVRLLERGFEPSESRVVPRLLTALAGEADSLNNEAPAVTPGLREDTA